MNAAFYMWSSEDIQALLQRSPSLQVISMPSREPFTTGPLTLSSPLPNVRQLRASRSTLAAFIPTITPSNLEDLSLDLTPFADLWMAEGNAAVPRLRTAELSNKYWIFEHLRSVEIIFDLMEAQLSLKKVLHCLYCVEYFRLAAPIDFSGVTSVDDLLIIPSRNLKYMLIGSKSLPTQYSVTARALFDSFPGLTLADFASHNSLWSTRSAARIHRRSPEELEMVTLKPLPPFGQWWEEVQRAVEVESHG
ncbi:hypothetical protein ONZ45_g7901 [Pleurotus djamor]|nr:hypothetical protein ONZ45_g7901 [Pleurotus djamor]